MKTRNCNFLNIKYGFTLAEVLITLVIIGVIAAMTIPSVINNTKKHEYVSGLKKAYSTLKSATNQIMVEEGSPRGDAGGWALYPQGVYNLYKNHLSIAKDCGNGRGCVDQLSTHGTGHVNGFKALSGNSYAGNNCELDTGFYKFILADGTQVIINDGSYPACDHGSTNTGSYGMCSAIFVDVNGEKGPNTWGRDVFYFAIKEDGLHPGGCDLISSCSKSGQGVGCACKVIRENAMNY